MAGLTALIYSCNKQQPVLKLINSTELNFPSASAIEFYQNKVYVFGDDAPHLLILNPDYQPIDSISYWNNALPRIPREMKPDIESCFIRTDSNRIILTGIGSMSATNRWKAIRYDIHNGRIDTSSNFLSKESLKGIPQLNIEGSAIVNTTVVLANRANLSNSINHLLFIDDSKSITVKKIIFPQQKTVAGISGLYYAKEKDLMLFTASEEATASTTEDGTIGESYLGGIENFSVRMNEVELKPDFFYRLSKFDQQLTQQKIESVCVEKVEGNVLTLHLAADNDNGKSRLFKIQFNWEKR